MNNRRKLLFGFTSLVSVAVLFGINPAASRKTEVDNYLKQKALERARQPNVLLIVLDDCGWGDLGPYKNNIGQTPTIDKIADRGIKFERFHSASPVCGPSRVGIFTGKAPSKSGVNANLNKRNTDINTVEELPADVTSLLSVFKSSGYRTGFFGKAHFGSIKNGVSMAERGADSFFCWGVSHEDAKLYNDWARFEGVEEWPYPMQSVYKNGKNDEIRLLDEKVAAETLKFVQGSKGQPWFASVNFNTPHTPLDPRHEDRNAISRGEPYWSRTDEKIWGPDQMYYGALRSLDLRCIAPILQWIEENGQLENTIVLVTSDNGAMRPDNPNEAAWTSGYNGGYSGWKAQLDLGGLRVPMIISWPGTLAENAISSNVGYLCDILPTLINLCGLERPIGEDFDGEDISYSLLSADKVVREKSIFWHYPQISAHEMNNATPTLCMLSEDGRWFFQCDADRSDKFKPYRPALYDVILDPAQTDNLYTEDTNNKTGAISAKMATDLLTWADTNLPNNWAEFRTRESSGWIKLPKSDDAFYPID